MQHRLKRARWYGDDTKIAFLKKFIETDIFLEAIELALIEEDDEQERLVDLNQAAGPLLERSLAYRRGALGILKRLEKLATMPGGPVDAEPDAWGHVTETTFPQNLPE